MDELDDNTPLDLKPEPCGICGDGGHEAWACPNQTKNLTLQQEIGEAYKKGYIAGGIDSINNARRFAR